MVACYDAHKGSRNFRNGTKIIYSKNLLRELEETQIFIVKEAKMSHGYERK